MAKRKGRRPWTLKIQALVLLSLGREEPCKTWPWGHMLEPFPGWPHRSESPMCPKSSGTKAGRNYPWRIIQVGIYSWRCSRPGWIWLWAAWSGQWHPAHRKGVRTRWFKGLFPPKQFYSCMILSFYLLQCSRKKKTSYREVKWNDRELSYCLATTWVCFRFVFYHNISVGKYTLLCFSLSKYQFLMEKVSITVICDDRWGENVLWMQSVSKTPENIKLLPLFSIVFILTKAINQLPEEKNL